MIIYQDDFFIPGILPSFANSRKQIRHKSKAPIYPLFLPHLKQRRTMRVENLGVFFALAITDFFAIILLNKHYRPSLQILPSISASPVRDYSLTGRAKRSSPVHLLFLDRFASLAKTRSWIASSQTPRKDDWRSQSSILCTKSKATRTNRKF